MSYVLKSKIANKSNYGGSRNTSAIKYIVIHYTGNDGDHDESNANYFANNIVKASAHYFVDDDSVTQSVPDNYTAYSVGGKKYSNCSQTGGGTYYGKCTNANSISIELCDVNKNGVIYPSDKTIENALELVKSLMKKYNIPEDRVIRHFDVNGKSCPAYWVDSKKWESAFHSKLGETVTTTTASESATSGDFKVKVSRSDLWIRKGAGTNYDKTKYIKPGTYTITEVKSGKGSTAGWGRLKSGAGWISLDYVTRV